MSKDYQKDDHKSSKAEDQVKEYKGKYSKGKAQYGKKGSKPRNDRADRGIQSLDDIVTNDISYWNKTGNFRNVTKLNWDLIVGNPRNVEHLLPYLGESATAGNLNPTQIMVIRYLQGPGYAGSVNDGVNRALAMLMAKIRASLSTSNIGFETADLGILFASTSSISALIGLAKRTLETYTMWQDRNYAYPRALIKSIGYDFTDIANNINKYASRLNALIDMYNNMSLVDMFDIYDRQYSMAHNVFVDEDSELGQLYMFLPENYYIYDDTVTPNRAQCKRLILGDVFEDLLVMIENAIMAWYGSSDLYTINGVMLRAFKDAPRQVIPHFTMGDMINPVNDRAFLMQIMNCTIFGEPTWSGPDFDSADITQDPDTQNYVIWAPIFPDGNNQDITPDVDQFMLRIFENDVTEEDNMEMTRLLNFKTGGPIGTSHELVDCGSEIVTRIDFNTYDTVTDTTTHHIITSNYLYCQGNGDLTGDSENLEFIKAIQAISPFRYIPCIHKIYMDATTNGTTYGGIIGDIYNWMLYNRDDWRELQFVAYQSLWMPKNLGL